MPAPKPNRVLSGRSVRELTDYKESIRSELTVDVYSLSGDKFIVAPLDGKCGACVQWREVTVLPFDVEDDVLGCCICDNLLWNIPSVPTNRGQSTNLVWPVLKASGCKAMKHFEQTAIRTSVSTINTAFRIETRPVHTLDRIYIGAGLPLGALHMEIAAEIRNTLKATTVLQTANLI
jgi:hypothetical protein